MTTTTAPNLDSDSASEKRVYNRFLLLVAGLGGLLYGIDVGIIGGALPYLEATANLTPGQLSIIVAAVLLGSVLSTLFAGMIADRLGRRLLMVLSGVTFAASIPIIALSHGYGPLFAGRLLQGVSGGFVGVVVPLYLAECLPAAVRGRGTAVFQWLLTLGIVAAALIGIYYSYQVAAVTRLGNAAHTFQYESEVWRRIFWVSLPPGLLFIVGSFMVAESPRWLFQRNRFEAARKALLRSRTPARAELEMEEMAEMARTASVQQGDDRAARFSSLLRRKYVVPFALACVLLFCNTATGINSIIGYNTGILLQSGLSDLSAHWGYVIFTVVNFLMTLVGLTLVDRKGRRFLFILGTAGVTLSLVCVGLLFVNNERHDLNCRAAVQTLVQPDGTLALRFDPAEAAALLKNAGYSANRIDPARASMTIIYSYGGFTGETEYLRSGSSPSVHIQRTDALPSSRTEALFKAPFANLAAAKTAPLHIERASIAQVPSARYGWLVAIALYTFMAFFAMGPGACIWVALSELMPTRIRSNGMSIALVINQLVSTVLAAIFLPFVSKYGYSSMFFLFAGFTLFYFVVVTFFVPETKGKTLEEIEALFERRGAHAPVQ